jgi:DNA-binding XRE family transcriptional regulator
MLFRGKHIRAARAWLNWSQDVLCEKSGLSKQAVFDFENDAVENPRLKTVTSMIAAFEAENIRVFENGIEEIKENTFTVSSFMEVLYDADLVLKKNDIIYFHCADDRRSSDEVTKKLQELEGRGVNLRFTYEKGNLHFSTNKENYRWIDPELFASSEVEVVYGDRCVLHIVEEGNSKFQVIKNKANAGARRKQIEYFWYRGERP